VGSVGAGEVILIAILAIVVFGPKRLPEISRKAAQILQQARKATQTLTEAMDMEYVEITAPIKDLKTEYEATRQAIRGMAPTLPNPSFMLPGGTKTPERPVDVAAAASQQPADEVQPLRRELSSEPERIQTDMNDLDRTPAFDESLEAIGGAVPPKPYTSAKLPSTDPTQMSSDRSSSSVQESEAVDNDVAP